MGINDTQHAIIERNRVDTDDDDDNDVDNQFLQTRHNSIHKNSAEIHTNHRQ
jgi:hypothetical protein